MSGARVTYGTFSVSSREASLLTVPYLGSHGDVDHPEISSDLYVLHPSGTSSMVPPPHPKKIIPSENLLPDLRLMLLFPFRYMEAENC